MIKVVKRECKLNCVTAMFTLPAYPIVAHCLYCRSKAKSLICCSRSYYTKQPVGEDIPANGLCMYYCL